MKDRLQELDPDRARIVDEILQLNKAERHIRGGMATREKYLHRHAQEKCCQGEFFPL